MKKIRFFSLLMVSMVILSAQTTIAQNTTFKLSDYKNPNYLYQTLELNFDLNNRVSSFTNKSFITNFHSNYSLRSNAGARYSSYGNSSKSQSEYLISFDGGIHSLGNYNTLDPKILETKSNSFNHNENLVIAGLKRFYNEKQNYFEFNGSFSTTYNGISMNNKFVNADTLTASIKSNSNYSGNNVSGAFLIGKGRIEQVQDARLAMYLLDDLHRLNRDKRSASDEDVLALAHLITSLKYKRFFDSRFRKIAEITAIDSFLQSNKIAGTPDAAYFTSLTDNWNYAINPVRNSGRRMFTGIEADFNYNFNENNLDDKLTNQNISEATLEQQGGSIFAIVGLNCEKPLSLIWQKTVNFKAGIGSNYNLQSNTISVSNPDSTNDINTYSQGFPSVKLTADYGYGYYPNSRTWLIASWQLSSGYEKIMVGTSREDKKNSNNHFYANTGPRVQAYYYLSEKLRLQFTFNGEFSFTNTKLTNAIAPPEMEKNTKIIRWNQNLSAALTYSLF